MWGSYESMTCGSRCYISNFEVVRSNSLNRVISLLKGNEIRAKSQFGKATDPEIPRQRKQIP